MQKTNYVTGIGYRKLAEELEHLKKVRRPEIAARIKEAKEQGDLSENAEYADAREEQSFTEGRILELEDLLKNAEVIDNKNTNPETVEIGDTIMASRGGEEREYTIVGGSEADPANGKISNESPLGQAFLGRKVKEAVTVKTPKGEVEYTIVKLKT